MSASRPSLSLPLSTSPGIGVAWSPSTPRSRPASGSTSPASHRMSVSAGLQSSMPDFADGSPRGPGWSPRRPSSAQSLQTSAAGSSGSPERGAAPAEDESASRLARSLSRSPRVDDADAPAIGTLRMRTASVVDADDDVALRRNGPTKSSSSESDKPVAAAVPGDPAGPNAPDAAPKPASGVSAAAANSTAASASSSSSSASPSLGAGTPAPSTAPDSSSSSPSSPNGALNGRADGASAEAAVAPSAPAAATAANGPAANGASSSASAAATDASSAAAVCTRAEQMCDRCGDYPAFADCRDCKVAFCRDCSQLVHSKGKWTTHVVVKRGAKSEEMSDEKRARIRQNVAGEILKTEARFIADLERFRNLYVLPIRSGRFPELLSHGKDVMVLFSTVDLVLDGNRELLSDLQESLRSNVPMFGKIFYSKLDHFQLYSVFCNHQEEAVEQVLKCSSSSPAFKAYLDQCKETPDADGQYLGFNDYFATPWQRIMRYPMLLQELLKHTPPDHADYANIAKALDKIRSEVDVINKNKAGAANLKKLLELHNSIDGLGKAVKLLEHGRLFVKEGIMTKISRNKVQERHFFLFNDLLIYARREGGATSKRYTFRGLIELDKMLFEDLPDTPSLQNAIQITRADRNRTYIVYPETPKEKLSWLREFEIQTDEVKHRSGLRDSEQDDALVDGKGIGFRPVWKPDHAVDNCCKCNGRFHFRNRKHHCRACGLIYCHLCSNYESELPKEFEYDSPQRVCLDCFLKLSTPPESEPDASPRSPSRRLTRAFTVTSLLPSRIDSNVPEECFKEGYMVKKGHRRTNWKRRFFVLMKGTLYYFRSDLDGKPEVTDDGRIRVHISKAKGVLQMRDFLYRPIVDREYKWCFELESRKKSYIIRAENQEDFEQWSRVFQLFNPNGLAPD